MSRIVVIGERTRVVGFALAGARAFEAERPGAVRAAWEALDDDVEVVVLTPSAAEALGDTAGPAHRLRVVMPTWT